VRAALEGASHEVVAVGALAGEGDKQAARDHLARINGSLTDDQGGFPLIARQGFQDVCQFQQNVLPHCAVS
jgi:hypothetical protein